MVLTMLGKSSSNMGSLALAEHRKDEWDSIEKKTKEKKRIVRQHNHNLGP